MMTAYYIYKEDLDSVANCFNDFNKTFEDICAAYKDVTGEDARRGFNAKALQLSCEALKQKIATKENPERYFIFFILYECLSLITV